MNKEQEISIIKLDAEGTLLKTCIKFHAIVEQENGVKMTYTVVDILPGDFLLFLGTKHFRSQKGEMLAKAVIDKVITNTESHRQKIHKELFHGPYFTSLNFLWKEKIVKVNWHGKCSLDQLFKASHFMYLHFKVPESARKLME